MSLAIPQMLSNQKLVDFEGLCGRWVLKHKDPGLGTTFPPSSQNITFLQQGYSKTSELRTKCKCLSDPDISSEEMSSCELNNLDEDLFEFDTGSPVSDTSCDIGSELDINAVINVIEDEEDGLSDDGGRFSVSSDTSSDCSHSNECGGRSDGFQTIFGSASSGIGSEITSTHYNVVDEDVVLEGVSVDSSDWKDDCTNSSNAIDATNTTTILAASPMVDTPTVSTDTEDEDNFVETNTDEECITSQDLDSGISEEDQSDQINSTLEELEPAVQVSNTYPDPEKVEIHHNFVVSTHKLNTLLEQLEVDKLETDKDISPGDDDTLCSPTPIQHKDSVYERPKLRKATSLRSGRTPPTSPGCRKIVRFADILGLDLSEVKVFSDEIPRIPKEAFEDLDVNLSEFDVGFPVSKSMKTFLPSQTTTLVPMFNQPEEAPNFMETVLERKVCLENAAMESPSVISGVVRVLNITFHKSVTVRWTDNDWATLKETDCKYMQGSSWGNMDKFSFKLVTDTLAVGSRLQFCLKYQCGGEHWDSNGGDNYVFQVFLNSTRSPPTVKSHPTGSRNISHSFYQAHMFPPLHAEEPWGRFM